MWYRQAVVNVNPSGQGTVTSVTMGVYAKNGNTNMTATNADGSTSVEVIDNNGRSYTKNRVGEVKVQLQDDMRTLKLFVQFEEDEEISID